MTRKEKQEAHKAEIKKLTNWFQHLMETEALSNAVRYYQRNRAKNPQKASVLDEAWKTFEKANHDSIVKYMIDRLVYNMGSNVNQLYHEMRAMMRAEADEAFRVLASRRKKVIQCNLVTQS